MAFLDRIAGRKVALIPHMGLGDAFVIKGLVARLAERSSEVLVFCKARYEKSLVSLFEDLGNVFISPLKDGDSGISPAFGADGRLWRKLENQGYFVLPLGYHTGNAEWLKLDRCWTRSFYRQLGLDPSDRYERFGTLQRDTSKNEAVLASARCALGWRDSFVVVHDDPARDMRIDPSWLPPGIPRIHVDDPRIRSDDVTDYLALFGNAAEIHCIDSCFAHMADAYFRPGEGPVRVVHSTRGRSSIGPDVYRGARIESHSFDATLEHRIIGPDGKEIR